jgi:hypothetical protein
VKKLTDFEVRACRFLTQFPRGFCPGWAEVGNEEQAVIAVLDSLVRKKRALVTAGDAGQVYTLTAQGEADAA